MSRRRTKRLLPAALPVAAVLLGAGLTAARKLRAARRARHQFRDPVAAPSQALEPLTPTPVDSAPSPSDSPSVEPLPAPTEPAAARRARGATTANVLEVLAKGGTMTAAEVALATGISRATISSTLSRLARTGEVAKAGRGYQLPDVGPPISARTPTPVADRNTGANAPARTVPGATKAKVLAALPTDGGLTASEVAAVTGLGRGTVSTTLSKLARNGEVVKADRGYRLP